MDSALLDFAKAFDRVWHRLLISKLDSHGIRNKLLSWIKNFLDDRQQRVLIGEALSEWISFESGVPQGSVLGPTLFIIFINDLLDQIENIGELYADDSKLLCALSNPDSHLSLQRDLDRIIEWTERSRLYLNTAKC